MLDKDPSALNDGTGIGLNCIKKNVSNYYTFMCGLSMTDDSDLFITGALEPSIWSAI